MWTSRTRASSSRTAPSPTSPPAASPASARASSASSSRRGISPSTWRRGAGTSSGCGRGGRGSAPPRSSRSSSTCGSTPPKRSRSSWSSRASCARCAARKPSWCRAPPGRRPWRSPAASRTPSRPRPSPTRGREPRAPHLRLGGRAVGGRARRRRGDGVATAPPGGRVRGVRRPEPRGRRCDRARPHGADVVVGFVEALWKLPAHFRLLARVREAFRTKRYGLAILVGYPGYHLRAAAAAHAAGVPVLYYSAPQLWAWAPGRVRRLAAVSRLAVILPFEETFFRDHGVPATFVGHPLRDRPPPPARAEARRALGLDPERPVLGLFPGSRAQEVRRLWPAFRGAAERVLAERPVVQVVVAGTSRARYPHPGAIRIHWGDPRPVFAAADAGLCKSGTTTLEAALADVPMAIAYRLNPVSFAIAIRLPPVPHVGLVNLIAGQEVAPEFLQGAVTPQALAETILPLLDPAGAAARRQRQGLALVRDPLGPPGAPRRGAAP